MKEGEIWVVLSTEGFGQEGRSGKRGAVWLRKTGQTCKVGMLGTQN